MKKDSSAHEYMEECRCHGCQLMLRSGVASGEDGETIHSLHYVLRLDAQNILGQPCCSGAISPIDLVMVFWGSGKSGLASGR